MKTNRIIVVANELIESVDVEAFANISHQALYRAYRESDEYSLSWDDIFIGNQANWRMVKERVEEYILLSHLRGGKLELIYYSPYDHIEKIYNSSYRTHLQFYETCIAMEEMKELGDGFNPSFKFELLRMENKGQLFPILQDQELRKLPLKMGYFTENDFSYLKIA